MLRRFAAIALVITVAACAAEDPAAVDLTGTWEGPYTHATTPGTLTLAITATDDDFEGTFAIAYEAGLGNIQTVSGPVTGTRPSATSVVFTTNAAGFTWTFVGQLTNANLIQGTWEAAEAPGTEGLFELERQ
jgi:hypothetical protein